MKTRAPGTPRRLSPMKLPQKYMKTDHRTVGREALPMKIRPVHRSRRPASCFSAPPPMKKPRGPMEGRRFQRSGAQNYTNELLVPTSRSHFHRKTRKNHRKSGRSEPRRRSLPMKTWEEYRYERGAAGSRRTVQRICRPFHRRRSSRGSCRPITGGSWR